LLAQRPRAADQPFERLYQDHVHAVYRYALAVLHNEADAEDVTQTTFLSAYRAFQRGERPERPHNWLIKIAHNVCRQRFRDSSRRPQEVEFDEAVAAAAPEDSDVPSATEIRRALGFLGFNQRAALVMRELEGRSYAEIAQILDVTVGAVETLIFRARRALREQLEGGLTCEEVEITLSRLQEQKLSSHERGALRAHLRECQDCAVLERRARAQRTALKNLGLVPLPASLGSWVGGGTAAGTGAAFTSMGLGAKLASVLAAGVVATGVAYEAADIASGGKPAGTKPAAVIVSGSSTQTRHAQKNRLAARRVRGGKAGRAKRHGRVADPDGGTAAGSASGNGAGAGSGQGGATEAINDNLPVTPPVNIEIPPLLPPPPIQIPPVTLPPIPPVTLPPPPQLPGQDLPVVPPVTLPPVTIPPVTLP
jgi:RNA polymerase sigma factor (sigma-70 family)